MLVKLAFPVLDVDMLKIKEFNTYVTDCVAPRRPKRGLPPLPEDKECSSMDLKKCSRITLKRRRNRRQYLSLPALPEHDEC